MNDTADRDLELVRKLDEARRSIADEVHARIVGQDAVLEQMLICLFARGHGLFVGVPGLAKTLLVRTLADVLALDSKRIQFTPDLMPSDITGSDVLDENPATGERSFRFVHGPVFAQLLLADEINRTPPKTQAALLQAMAEGQVTASGHTYDLPRPFVVFATQNPIDQEGTYPLPEAQLDRFFMQIDVGYPTERDEIEIVRRTTSPETRKPGRVLEASDVLALQDLVPRVPIADHVIEHAVALVRATRPEDPRATSKAKSYLAYGAGPRASQAIALAAKTRAVLHGRFAAERDDVRAVAPAILRHRLVLSFRARAERIPVDAVIEDVLVTIPA